jgi:hypothetical protein
MRGVFMLKTRVCVTMRTSYARPHLLLLLLLLV